jgi:hypothetical protein
MESIPATSWANVAKGFCKAAHMITSSPANRPRSTRDLSPSERSFVVILQRLGFGHIDFIKIRRGILIFDPRPTAVQLRKFGMAQREPAGSSSDFDLKRPLAEFFEYIRGVEDGAIRRLEIHHGLPFSIEVEYRIPRGMPDVKGEHVEAV